MSNLKNPLDKIISVIIAVIFLITSTAYGVDLSYKKHLRVPLKMSSQKKDSTNLEDTMAKVASNEKAVKPKAEKDSYNMPRQEVSKIKFTTANIAISIQDFLNGAKALLLGLISKPLLAFLSSSLIFPFLLKYEILYASGSGDGLNIGRPPAVKVLWLWQNVDNEKSEDNITNSTIEKLFRTTGIIIPGAENETVPTPHISVDAVDHETGELLSGFPVLPEKVTRDVTLDVAAVSLPEAFPWTPQLSEILLDHTLPVVPDSVLLTPAAAKQFVTETLIPAIDEAAATFESLEISHQLSLIQSLINLLESQNFKRIVGTPLYNSCLGNPQEGWELAKELAISIRDLSDRGLVSADLDVQIGAVITRLKAFKLFFTFLGINITEEPVSDLVASPIILDALNRVFSSYSELDASIRNTITLGLFYFYAPLGISPSSALINPIVTAHMDMLSNDLVHMISLFNELKEDQQRLIVTTARHIAWHANSILITSEDEQEHIAVLGYVTSLLNVIKNQYSPEINPETLAFPEVFQDLKLKAGIALVQSFTDDKASLKPSEYAYIADRLNLNADQRRLLDKHRVLIFALNPLADGQDGNRDLKPEEIRYMETLLDETKGTYLSESGVVRAVIGNSWHVMRMYYAGQLITYATARGGGLILVPTVEGVLSDKVFGHETAHLTHIYPAALPDFVWKYVKERFLKLHSDYLHDPNACVRPEAQDNFEEDWAWTMWHWLDSSEDLLKDAIKRAKDGHNILLQKVLLVAEVFSLVEDNSKIGFLTSESPNNKHPVNIQIKSALRAQPTNEDDPFYHPWGNIIGIGGVSLAGLVPWSGSTRVESHSEITPSMLDLKQNYPNPFGAGSKSGSPITTIELDIPEPTQVKVTIYNVLSQEVITLYDDMSQGQLRLTWDGKNSNGIFVDSGVYIVSVRTNAAVHYKKIIFLGISQRRGFSGTYLQTRESTKISLIQQKLNSIVRTCQ